MTFNYGSHICKGLAQKKLKIVPIILPNINDLTLANIAKKISSHTYVKLETAVSFSLFRLDMPIKSHKKSEKISQSKFL